jgi:hypothetical protein
MTETTTKQEHTTEDWAGKLSFDDVVQQFQRVNALFLSEGYIQRDASKFAIDAVQKKYNVNVLEAFGLPLIAEPYPGPFLTSYNIRERLDLHDGEWGLYNRLAANGYLEPVDSRMSSFIPTEKANKHIVCLNTLTLRQRRDACLNSPGELQRKIRRTMEPFWWKESILEIVQEIYSKEKEDE